jgi:hypothetical protein
MLQYEHISTIKHSRAPIFLLSLIPAIFELTFFFICQCLLGPGLLIREILEF